MTLKRRIEHAERYGALPDDLSHLSETELDARIAEALSKLSEVAGGPTKEEWAELLEHAVRLGWSGQKIASAKSLVGV